MLIHIKRAEGPSGECRNRWTALTFKNADEILSRMSNTAPKDGGYDKVDFNIVDAAAKITYSGRYDLKHYSVQVTDLKGHVVDFLEFCGGISKPERMTQAQYEECIVWDTQEFRDECLVMANYFRSQT